MTDDVALHTPLVGRPGSRALLNTPVLVVDGDALDRNIAAMARLAAERGVALRPHAKTHKSVDIARRQRAAGAVGLCCAKLGEAEALAAGGIDQLLITSPVAAPGAIARLAALAERSPGLMTVADHPDVVDRIAAATAERGTTIGVVVDIDPGIHRTGVAAPPAAVALARRIGAHPTLHYRGVQFYCGAQQHIEDYATRRAAVEERTDYLRSVIAALDDAGLSPALITGSGTGTHRIDLDLGVFNELQCGSYVFMDTQYFACDLTGDEVPFEPALMVDARVVSANHSALVTLDAGFKALSTDGGKPGVHAGAPRDAAFVFMGDEHGALVAAGIGDTLAPGDPVSLIVPHCDPTGNLYDHYHVVRCDTLHAVWPVSARGRSR